jgi:hypothetical protein
MEKKTQRKASPQILCSNILLIALTFGALGVAPTHAAGLPPDSTADVVYGQGGDFTTRELNKGGISASSLYGPHGLALDNSGNLYVAEKYNSRVLYFPAGSTIATRVYGQGGNFTTNAENKGGISANSLDLPVGVALDSGGNLYIADCNNNRVLYYPAGSTTATRVYGQSGSFTTNKVNKGGVSANSLYQPEKVAVDSSDNLYVADSFNNRVLYYPAGSTTATRVYGQGGDFTTNTANKGGVSADSLSIPAGIALDRSGNLYVAERRNNRVLYFPAGSTSATRVYGQGGDFTTNIENKGGISADSLYFPLRVFVDDSDNLYVGDVFNNRVLYFPAGSTTATFVYGQAGSFTTNTANKDGVSADSLYHPTAIVLDSSGNLYVADKLNHRVLKYAVSTSPPDTIAPTVDSFTVPSLSTSLDIPIMAFTASDNIGVIGYLITETSASPASSDPAWMGVAPAFYNVAQSGVYTLYPWARDAAGNVSLVFGSPPQVTVEAAPDAFSKLAPANGAGNQPASLVLSWGASSQVVSYEYCIDTINNQNCDTSWLSTGSDTFANLSGLVADTYYWQVRAVDGTSTTYADSGLWWTFMVPLAPGAFGKSIPSNGVTKQALSLRLFWRNSERVKYFEYCLDTINDAICNTEWVSTGWAERTAISGLSPGVTYYWQVRANNANGTTYANDGAWWSFSTLPLPGAFGKSRPANGAIKQVLAPILGWGASSNAKWYEYCIDTINNDSSNDDACDTKWVSTGLARSVALSGLSRNTTYYWQARANNASGVTYANGGVWWSFTTIP